jgi:ribosomal protein S18 acetylase RimI-like enzyme
MGVELRRARVADAQRLTELGRITFTETFGHRYPAEDLEAFLAAEHRPEKYAAWIADPAWGVWVVGQAGEIIGYTVAGPCGLPHVDVTPACGELKRIYVLSGAQGLGAGSLMLKESLDWLTKPGRALWIGVWSENHGAQRLYGRQGFEKVGTYDFMVGACRDHEFILKREG